MKPEELKLCRLIPFNGEYILFHPESFSIVRINSETGERIASLKNGNKDPELAEELAKFGSRLISIHNLRHYRLLTRRLRNAVLSGTFEETCQHLRQTL